VISLLSTVMAFHHATLLLLPWLVLAITTYLLMGRQVKWQTLSLRLFIIGILSTLAMLTVIWPFWEWGHTQSMKRLLTTPRDIVFSEILSHYFYFSFQCMGRWQSLSLLR
jgi:hypothetical protein